MSKKPNILILYSDQHSRRTLGCYGNDQVITPNLNRLANEGVVLENAITQNPICTPSRMCLLSGQYVHNFGMYGLMGDAPENLPTLFEFFKDKGYTTGVSGKIHTPTGWIQKGCDYIKDGYGYEKKVAKWNSFNEEGCQGTSGDDYDMYLAKLGLYKDRDDKVLHEVYEKVGHNGGQGLDSRFSKIPKEHSFEAWSANCCNDFIEKAVEEDQPFCYWLTMPRPHQTYAPSKEFWDMYENVDLELPPNSENKMEQRSSTARSTQKGFQENMDWVIFGGKDFDEVRRRVLRGYYACVTQMDDAIGMVLDKLEDLNIRENTIIVYTTDHGEFAGEHGMIEKAPGIGFGCVTQIPMIFSWKGKLEGNVRRKSFFESIDIFPTVSSLAGLEEPNWVDGLDLSKTLISDENIKDFGVTENANTKTIHTKKYKLTQYLPEFEGEDFGELFDMENDPFELNNLYFDDNYKSVVNDLRYKLYCWLVRTTRVTTVHPNCPIIDSKKGVIGVASWDLAKHNGIVDKDKKVGQKFYSDLIKHNRRNYL